MSLALVWVVFFSSFSKAFYDKGSNSIKCCFRWPYRKNSMFCRYTQFFDELLMWTYQFECDVED